MKKNRFCDFRSQKFLIQSGKIIVWVRILKIFVSVQSCFETFVSCKEFMYHNFEIRYIYPVRKLNNHSHFQQYKSLATTLTTNYRIWEGGSFLHIKSLSKKEIPRSLQESPMIERSGVSFIRKFIGKFENTAPPIMSK